MTRVTIGTWGKSLAVRVPANVARAVGLTEGEAVEIEAVDGSVVIRRDEANDERRRDALAAARAIQELARGSRLHGLSIRELIDEGRKY